MKKYTIEYIKDCFERESYQLLSDKYIGINFPLEFICPNGHKHQITFGRWLRGQRCAYCNGNLKLSKEFIKNEFEKEGYQLLSNYINSETKLKYRCNKGHLGYIKWSHWKNGHRCAECAGNKKKNIEFIREEFSKEHYILLTNDYINSRQKLSYRCPNGHLGSISWDSWNSGYRCAKCGVLSAASKCRIDYVFIKNAFQDEGYTLLTREYKNAFSELEFICPNGHNCSTNWNKWQRGLRCSKCNTVKSLAERELDRFFEKFGVLCVYNTRDIISPYELDIVIPDKKLAIEYCGLYWHSELAGKDRRYHLKKLERANAAGLRLITIFEDEFVNNNEIVFSRLKQICGFNSTNTKIFARDCVVREIPYTLAAPFCKTNHSQGYQVSNIKLGLFFKDELISVMTFAKPSFAKGYKNKSNYVWELARFCSKLNYSVVGGASKLLKYFENNYKWNKIFSYADRRWSDGGLYEKLGFKLESVTQPSYWYIKGQKRIHRFALRKTEHDPKDRTEWEIRKSQGWNRIWDCGNFKFIKQR